MYDIHHMHQLCWQWESDAYSQQEEVRPDLVQPVKGGGGGEVSGHLSVVGLQIHQAKCQDGTSSCHMSVHLLSLLEEEEEEEEEKDMQ